MANDDHVAQLAKGVAAWNAWRRANPDVLEPDLSEVNLSEANLAEADLCGANLMSAILSQTNLSNANLREANLIGATLIEANLTEADLSGAQLIQADFTMANLSRANLSEADLRRSVLTWSLLRETNLRNAKLLGASPNNADLSEADLGEANLSGADLSMSNLSGTNLERATLSEANLSGTNLSKANLSGAGLSRSNLSRSNLSWAGLNGANLTSAVLVETNLRGADLTGCHVYGISAWNLTLDGCKQQNLVVTPSWQPEITVDNIEVAQFLYLLLNNPKIRDVIDTIGKKGVLLLGRFSDGRIQLLERVRDKLRSLGFVPIVFNFDKPDTKDFTETVRLLANLSHFVIVDITNPRSVPLELQAVVPDYMIPFVPILERGHVPFSMFVDLQNKYDWVLDVIVYSSVDRLIEVFDEKIVKLAEEKFNQLLARRAQKLRVEEV